jgi:YD repeat-containing protein
MRSPTHPAHSTAAADSPNKKSRRGVGKPYEQFQSTATWKRPGSHYPRNRVRSTYAIGSEGGSVDMGLPTRVYGDPTTDQNARTPSNYFAYDANGNLVGYNNGDGRLWSYAYSTTTPLNEPVTFTAPSSKGTSTVGYYPDGSVKYTETPWQHQLDAGRSNPDYAVSYTYDADGNVVSETHHHGGQYATPAPTLPTTDQITTRYYDGLDRLVEVIEPQDPGDVFQNFSNPNASAWITRYLYDLSGYAGGSNSFAYTGGSQDVTAHGNLWKVQELLPAGSSTLEYTPATPAPSPSPIQSSSPAPTTSPIGGGGYGHLSVAISHLSSTTFQDMKAWKYDALDRNTAVYSVVTAGGNPGTLNAQTMQYDRAGFNQSFPGLLNWICNSTNQCQHFGYDAIGRMVTVSDNNSANSTSRTQATPCTPPSRNGGRAQTLLRYEHSIA